jgi:glycosyltransferase involved in cell wall biosynthesis
VRVLLDMRPSVGGLARYAGVLARRLDEQPGAEVIRFGCGSAAWGGPAPIREPSAVRQMARRWARFPFRLLDDLWRIPLAARREGADLVHATSGFAPFTGRRPLVLTCHDLWAFDHPETRPDRLLAGYERRRLLAGLRTAAHVLTDSCSVANELRRRFGIPGERLSCVTPPLASPAPPDMDAVEALGLPASFFLSVGSVEPRKNYARLLQAQAEAYPHTAVPLVIVGRYGWQAASLRSSIQRAAPAVRWPGYVTDGTLSCLYERALALVQFSLEEGFDYPLAEAMRAGLPAIVSDIPVHREVAGDAAVHVSPRDIGRLAALLVEAANWPAAERRACRLAGLKRGAALVCAGDVQGVLTVYANVLNKRTEKGAQG